MPKSGKQLEQLVKAIESHLLPEGFSVEANERIFNDAGVQVAEFDIIITGSLGSSSVSWLIECRDRQSEGAAPANWIEQLVGRRHRFNFDKVIAVSTTGFAEGAKDFAEREGILLRTVETIMDLASDFQCRAINWKILTVESNDIMEVNADPRYNHFFLSQIHHGN